MHRDLHPVCWGARAWLFFVPDGETESERRMRERRAKSVCASCPSVFRAYVQVPVSGCSTGQAAPIRNVG